MRYDPTSTPRADEWLALDEGVRIAMVIDYHEAHGGFGENVRMHAAIHVVVENQLALGKPIETRETLHRLRAEGLPRHEAVHAIGSVIAGSIFHLLKGTASAFDSEKYRAELSALSARAWRTGG